MIVPAPAADLVAAIDAVLADPDMTPADLRLWALICSGLADALNAAADTRQRQESPA